jgi:hypothetical protein
MLSFIYRKEAVRIQADSKFSDRALYDCRLIPKAVSHAVKPIAARGSIRTKHFLSKQIKARENPTRRTQTPS